MSYGICTLSIIPCRKEPASVSEMVTQLLFGETYKVINPEEDWIQIESTYDSYPCWISRKQHNEISDKEYRSVSQELINSELIQLITNKKTNTSFPLTIGATLFNYKSGLCEINNLQFVFEGQTTNINQKKSVNELIQTAFMFLNAPYLWGGRSPFGIDCSGFTQLVYKINGYKLPRDASQQVEYGVPLSFVEEAEPGDLAFFDNEDGNIVHVGIVLDNQQIIHASGSVRVDKFDHYGIFNSDTKKYSHMLRVIKKII